MTDSPLPEGFVLAPEVSSVVLTNEYEHWTVADLIEMLSEYEPTARVWLAGDYPDEGDVTVRPVELIHSTGGEVFL